MRRLSLIVFLVCLMTTSVSATNTWTPGRVDSNVTTGSWSDPYKWSQGFVPADTEDVKINRVTTICTLDVDAGTFTTGRIALGGDGTNVTRLDIVGPNGKITINKSLGFKVGDSGVGGAGIIGNVKQTGGEVVITSLGHLSIGYKIGTGYYRMEGGTITSANGMYVGTTPPNAGGASGSAGTLTIAGTTATINITAGALYVGVSDPNAAWTGTGTLAFELSSGVSAINAPDVYIDPTGAAIANLVVSLIGEAPPVIVLVKNSGTNPVYGTFDSVTLNGAGLAGYTLVYNYNADMGTIGNDIALIPEPATIALFGLGLLALVRRPRRK